MVSLRFGVFWVLSFFVSLIPFYTGAELPNLVLLPIETSDDVRQYETEFGSALQEGLQSRYTVFYGSVVERELEKEYSKLDCTAESCNQNVAIAFNGELIADGSVKSTSSGYILKLVVSNVLTGEVVESTTEPCRDCDELDVLDALKKMGASGTQVSSTETTGAFGTPASLQFDTFPSGARVKIDGRNRGITPFLSGGFSVGQSIQVELDMDNFETQVLDVTLDKKLKVLDGIAMESAKQNISQAVLMFDSIPSTASIYINDRYIGVTPYQSFDHFVGERLNLRLELEGYQTKSEVVVVSQQILELPSFKMERFESAQSGTSAKFDGGVRFQKLDNNGFELNGDSTEWSCVQDNKTGLVWEAKSTDRDADKTYTYKKAESFAAGVNKGGLFKAGGQCGLATWRLPSKSELQSIKVPENVPSADLKFFPNTQKSEYWSSDSQSQGMHETIGFMGNVGILPINRKDSEQRSVRLVSNGFKPGVKLKMISIPGGTFEMGDLTGRQWRSLPVRTVTMKPFKLSQTEVTNAMWDRCVTARKCQARNSADIQTCPEQAIERDINRFLNGQCRLPFDEELHPVQNVSWNDIQDFIAWYSKEMGRKFRLPSEAEWEYAARAGTNTIYYWGNYEAGAIGYENCENESCGDSFAYTSPVASFKPNPFGLYDMSGNVSEFVQDCKNSEDYWGAPTDGSAWEESNCHIRVIRGGAFYHSGGTPPDSREGFVELGWQSVEAGFRLVSDD
jgi:formylglycine-generating enzyme required for sulfatase activity